MTGSAFQSNPLFSPSPAFATCFTAVSFRLGNDSGLRAAIILSFLCRPAGCDVQVGLARAGHRDRHSGRRATTASTRETLVLYERFVDSCVLHFRPMLSGCSISARLLQRSASGCRWASAAWRNWRRVASSLLTVVLTSNPVSSSDTQCLAALGLTLVPLQQTLRLSVASSPSSLTINQRAAALPCPACQLACEPCR